MAQVSIWLVMEKDDSFSKRSSSVSSSANSFQSRRDSGRWRTVRNLIHPQQFKESARLAPPPSLRNDLLAGLQTAFTAVLALTLVYLSPWSDMVGFAGLGALVALFARHTSHWQRHWLLLLAAAIQTSMVFMMSTAAYLGWAEWAQLALLSLLCGLLLLICSSTELGLPGPLIFIFGAGACVGSNPDWQQVEGRTLITGAAAMLG